MPQNQEEQIDLIIEVIPERDLRNQAWMHRFKSSFDLLKAFSKITLRGTRSDRDKHDSKKQLEQSSPANQTRHPGVLRCFNCNGTNGQSQKDCPNPRREWGTCYKCGNPSHRSACPQNVTTWIISTTQRESPIRKGPTIENLLQPVTPDTTFVVPSMFPGPALDAEGNTSYYVISAT